MNAKVPEGNRPPKMGPRNKIDIYEYYTPLSLRPLIFLWLFEFFRLYFLHMIYDSSTLNYMKIY